MIKLFWTGLLIVSLLAGCGFDGTPTRQNDFIPLTSIEIVAVPASIAAHTTTRLTAKGNFSGLFTRDITDQVVWSSNSTAVADFVTAGNPNRVSGIAAGSAVLTATVGTVSGTFPFTVTNATVTAMEVAPGTTSLPKGMTKQLTVKGTFSDTTTQDLTFDAVWSSTPGTFASVSDATASKGLVTARAEGIETITATFGSIPGTATVTVTPAVPQSIAVTSSSTSVLSLSTARFTATGHYSDGTAPDITSLVTWSSSNTGIATIAPGGAASTIAQGTTSISAALAGVSGSANLKVTGGNLTGITISPASATLVKDTAARISATGTFSNGASRDITGAVAWSTANSAFASVTDPVGNLAWLNALAVTPALNPTTVTATVNRTSVPVTRTANLAVSAPALLSITIVPPAGFVDLTAGTSARFTVTASFNGMTQDVTANAVWTSDPATIASVGDVGISKGRVSGVAAGTTTIRAEYGGLTASAQVTVKTRVINTLTISGGSAVTSGNQVRFTATANYTDGAIKDVTEDSTWTIDKTNVAILADSQNQPGQVVGVDSGTATLTAAFGGKTQTLTVTITQ